MILFSAVKPKFNIRFVSLSNHMKEYLHTAATWIESEWGYIRKLGVETRMEKLRDIKEEVYIGILVPPKTPEQPNPKSIPVAMFRLSEKEYSPEIKEALGRTPRVQELAYVFVEESYRNFGLGKQIIQAAQNIAAGLGADHLILETLKTNLNGFYRKLGADVIAESKLFGEPVDVLTLFGRSKTYSFRTKNQNQKCTIQLVQHPNRIDQDAARAILVSSFVGEYQQYLEPHEIDPTLSSWSDVERYYEDYFSVELEEFSSGKLQFWVEAKIAGQLVGWATFQREALKKDAVYMNLLIVHPQFQKSSIGTHLVYALNKLGVIPELSAVHLLLRAKNQGGREFYTKLGFEFDPHYQRKDNFVSIEMLQPFTWKNPALQHVEAIEQKENVPWH